MHYDEDWKADNALMDRADGIRAVHARELYIPKGFRQLSHGEVTGGDDVEMVNGQWDGSRGGRRVRKGMVVLRRREAA